LVLQLAHAPAEASTADVLFSWYNTFQYLEATLPLIPSSVARSLTVIA